MKNGERDEAARRICSTEAISDHARKYDFSYTLCLLPP